MTSLSGITIDERYELLAHIGSGGMGAVYKATQHPFEREVAIKMLPAELPDEPDARARFEREAMAISALKHKNIVMFYGYGVYRGAPYMVMEYIDGRSLQQLLAKNEPLPPRYAMGIVEQIAEALSCAHANGLVHRDLKPSNVMIVGDENSLSVKIIDFGLARLLPSFGKDVQKLTEAGSAVGSILYMSPEQCIGKDSDARSDIYALGCILYHCLTGVPPFGGDHSVVVMQKHLMEPLPLMQTTVPGISPVLQAIVDHATEKEPADRYQSADDMLTDIRAYLNGQAVIHDSGTRARSSPHVAPLRVVRNARRSPLFPAALIAAVLCAVAICVLVPKWMIPQAVPTEKSENPIVLFRQAEDAVNNKDLPTALDLFKRIVASDKRTGLLSSERRHYSYNWLAQLYLQDRQYDLARATAEEGIRRMTRDQLGSSRVGMMANIYAAACDEERHPEVADAFFEWLIHHLRRHDLSNWGTVFLHQVTRVHFWRGPQAAAELLRADLYKLPREKDRIIGMMLLGALLREQNKMTESNTRLVQAIEMASNHPGDIEIQRALGNSYVLIGEYDKARNVLEAFASHKTYGALVWPDLAVCAAAQGDYQRATQLLDDTITYTGAGDPIVFLGVRRTLGQDAKLIRNILRSQHKTKEAADFAKYLKYAP